MFGWLEKQGHVNDDVSYANWPVPCQTGRSALWLCSVGQHSACHAHWCFYVYVFVHKFYCLPYHSYCYKKSVLQI